MTVRLDGEFWTENFILKSRPPINAVMTIKNQTENF